MWGAHIHRWILHFEDNFHLEHDFIVSEMIYYESSGTLDQTRSLTQSQNTTFHFPVN